MQLNGSFGVDDRVVPANKVATRETFIQLGMSLDARIREVLVGRLAVVRLVEEPIFRIRVEGRAGVAECGAVAADDPEEPGQELGPLA